MTRQCKWCAIVFSILMIVCMDIWAQMPPALELEWMANPISSMHKVQRDEFLTECFGTLSALRWEKVAPYESLEAVRTKTLKISLAGNEFESVQVVIKSPEADLKNVQIKVSDLMDSATKKTFPAAGVSLWQVGYVEMFSLWNSRQNLGWWPDPLFPIDSSKKLNIPHGQNQPILMQFYADEKTAAGIYRGVVTLTAEGQKDLKLPIEVTVWNFSIPKEQHFTLSVPIWGGQMEAMYPGSMTPENRRAYLDILLDYRVSPFPLDTNEEMKYCFDRGMRNFCLKCFPGDHVPADTEKNMTELQKNWKDQPWTKDATPYVLLGDEPKPPQWPTIKKQGELVREFAPDIVRMNTLCLYGQIPSDDKIFYEDDVLKKYLDYYKRALTALGKSVDYFMPAVGAGYPARETTKMAREMGCDTWWYYVGDIVYIPTSGAYTRASFWGHWKYRIPGLLHWGMSYWGDANVAGENGKKWPQVAWNTTCSRGGDGSLVYPAGLGKFLPSLRLELLRDGVEDYEYFRLLESLITQLEKKDSSKYAEQIKKAQDLLTSVSILDQADDAVILLKIRSQVARQIETLTRALSSGNQ